MRVLGEVKHSKHHHQPKRRPRDSIASGLRSIQDSASKNRKERDTFTRSDSDRVRRMEDKRREKEKRAIAREFKQVRRHPITDMRGSP